MRTMLSFLDDRIGAGGLNIDVQMHPGGMFITRLRDRLADLISSREGEESSRRPRRRAENGSAEERSVVRRCNREMERQSDGSAVPQHPENSTRENGRVLRIVFPYAPVQELRLLFFAPQQTEEPRDTIIYEFQINIDIFESASEPPVTVNEAVSQEEQDAESKGF
ncbi:zinc finger domain-containing ubiquitin ligase [Biomphalaria pfeifferi]|uniref:Zinc finger domain-containing ubiquitin ligase n=1 Tax=Biomphalaria pfeifferi TaxID=112525 RepID=A0AAD8AN02_BIOPF|nr:zinc finger domain-containing ubiquitin ligase [Biomphalaria pfeifferi]